MTWARLEHAWMALIALLLCLPLGSCHAHKRRVIAVIPETTAQELWESAHAGAEHAARELGFEVYWNGPTREDDLSRQIQIVDKMVGRDVYGLILAPDHSVALISPIRAALARGIPTVIVGSPLGVEPRDNLVFIVNDDEATGRLVAARLAPQVHAGDVVAILGNNPAILSHAARTSAIQSALQALAPGVQVVERHSTSFSFDEAEQAAEETIRGVPHLRAIVSLSINQTRATYFALRRSPPPAPILLIGCDQDLDLVRRVRLGEIDSLVAQDTGTMGYEAVKTISELRAHSPVPSMRHIVPVLITRENVDLPSIQKVLDMNWRIQ